MKSYRVFFSPEAEEHLNALEEYIAKAAGPRIAANYVLEIVQFCRGLKTLPHRGKARNDLRPGIRTVGFRRRR